MYEVYPVSNYSTETIWPKRFDSTDSHDEFITIVEINGEWYAVFRRK